MCRRLHATDRAKGRPPRNIRGLKRVIILISLGVQHRLSPSGALSARGISIATAKTSVNAGQHRRTYRQEPGHKGGDGGALKYALHRRREDAPWGRRTCVPAELPGVVLSAYEHRLDRIA